MIVSGSVTVPGDKSISHRALFLAGLASGRSELHGLLTSHDAQSTAGVLRQLGVSVEPLVPGRPVTVAAQGWTRPSSPLDCGNSGTSARLALGILAAHPFEATITGDHSLSRRPMRRVTKPLAMMGAGIVDRGDGLPVTITGGKLEPLEYRMPVSSAQLKGSLLLAGLAAGVEVGVAEPVGRSRDHTELMLEALGYRVERDGAWVRLKPGARHDAFEMTVPGDISSAAFLVGAGLLADGGSLEIRDVGLNPTRAGYLAVLRRMGARVDADQVGGSLGEPRGTLSVRPSDLVPVEVEPHEIPGLIDEIPMLALLASRAHGESRFREVGELRVKESDRLGLIAHNLRSIGGQAEVQGQDLVVYGGNWRPRGMVVTEGDHRLAMAFMVLGTISGSDVTVDDPGCAAVSFPDFEKTLKGLGRSHV